MEGIQSWIISVAVSVGLLLLLLLIILLWWVSITLICGRYTDLNYKCSCLSGTSFTSSSDHSSMVGKYHTDMWKIYRP